MRKVGKSVESGQEEASEGFSKTKQQKKEKKSLSWKNNHYLVHYPENLTISFA